MDVSLEQARSFCALVDHNGYSGAAKALHKSHSAIVYGINALELIKTFDSEISSINNGMYSFQIDESLHNYCYSIKEALMQFINTSKIAFSCGRKSAIIENSINAMYDEVSKYNASNKEICAKYGIYIDSQKYKLNLDQKIDIIEKFLI